MPIVPRDDTERRARRVVLIGFAVLAVWFTGAFPPFVNPNELSRFDMVYAVVEQGTFRIDDALHVLGEHEDRASSNGHFYSNKAPGLALAAVPVYSLLRTFLPAPRSGTAPLLIHVLPLLTVSLVSVVALWRLGERVAKAAPRGGALVLAAVAFGTCFVYYARTFFGHAWSAALLVLAWDLLSASTPPGRRPADFRNLASGFLAAWALISEYTVLPIIAFLVVRSASGRSWRRRLKTSWRAAVPVLTLLAYQAACFGNPFVVSYAREAYAPYAGLSRQQLLGFGFPNPLFLLDFLFHPARGLLVFSPFLAFAAVGWVRWWRSREDRADCWFVLGTTLSLPLLLSAYPNWHGGWSLGSRYLVPILLFAALPIARSLATPLARGIFLAAATFSVLHHLVLTLTWPNFPPDVPWPAASGSRWFLERGWIANHVGPQGTWGDAFAVVLMALVFVSALAVSAGAAQPLVPRLPLTLLLGLAPLAILLMQTPELSFSARLWRAAIYGKWSGRDPDRKDLREVAESASNPADRRRAAGAWITYGAGAPLNLPPDSSNGTNP